MVVPPPPPPPPPQAERPPSAIRNASIPSIALHLLRRAGIPKNTSTASTAPPPAPSSPEPAGLRRSVVVAGVVVTASVALPDVLEAPSVMVPLGSHEGRLDAPLGEVVSEQLRVTVPA